ncbi:MAG: hypothetical protein FD147_1153 [Chloroflexi bacterium]|nr:MAG: hypothetical protein FD147_1153 [Chloroflexota bacterium]
MFDINLYTINLINGIEKNSLPGLIALTAPRRAARGRENDSLVVLLTLSGATTITAESLQAWLQKKGEDYYKTAGTVTFAMKSFVESINNELLDRNLKRAKDGGQISAMLNLAVIKRESVYLVNVGSTRTYFIGSGESIEFGDSENQGRGLGVDQMLACRFVQKVIQENDTLLFAPVPPVSWKAEAFDGSTKLSVDAFSRRLYNQVGTDLKAAMVRFITGKGSVNQTALRNTTTISSRSETPVFTEPVVNIPSAAVDRPISQSIVGSLTSLITNEPVQGEQVSSTGDNQLRPKERPISVDAQKTPVMGTTIISPGTAPRTIKTPKAATSTPSGWQLKVGKFTRSAVTWFTGIKTSGSRFIQKVLPGLSEEPLKLTRSGLIVIAVAVPILIVAIAGMVYVRNGKTQQFDLFLVQAQQYAIQAEAQINDAPSRLASLQQSFYWLEKAETYGQSDASKSLRLQVQGALDIIQGIQRLELRSVLDGGLPAGMIVSQIVPTATDLYLLDDTSGTVMRYFLSGSGYQKDVAFDCGPNPDNALNPMGKLVDMVPLNINNSFRATLFVIDASGNIEFCIPGESGVSGSLTPPDQGWRQLKSISLFKNYLYVLDIGGNAVYRYEGDGIQFGEKPTLYFDNQIPPLGEALEIEVNGDELYILRASGQMVECTYSHMKDYKLTECEDPALFGDMRTGQIPETINFPEAQFTQMRMTAAPDSSIYLLDSWAKTIFHFSLQRNLQKILHPRLSDGLNLAKLTPTAFAVSSGRIVFMAFSNQVYYAPLP